MSLGAEGAEGAEGAIGEAVVIGDKAYSYDPVVGHMQTGCDSWACGRGLVAAAISHIPIFEGSLQTRDDVDQSPSHVLKANWVDIRHRVVCYILLQVKSKQYDQWDSGPLIQDSRRKCNAKDNIIQGTLDRLCITVSLVHLWLRCRPDYSRHIY